VSLRIAIVGQVDHGKSTLIGKLLDETGQTRLERRERVENFCSSTGRKFEYAFLLDALEEEQAQGITIDVTEVNWSHEGRDYVFVDTPGHREFLKKMVGGASKVEAAILILDAAEGVTDTLRRQCMVLDLLGITQRIILINKMDLVHWSEEVWKRREAEVNAILPDKKSGRTFILPIAAWHGANLLAPSSEMPWYQGPTLGAALTALSTTGGKIAGPARFFVQDVYRMEEKRIYVGRVESGAISTGDTLTFHPGGAESRIRSIEVYGAERNVAGVGEAVGITLSDPLFLDRGHLGYRKGEAPHLAKGAVGDLFWLDSQPLTCGEKLQLKMGTRELKAVVEAIEHEIDPDSFNRVQLPKSISLFGRVRFLFDEEFAFDRFEEVEASGRFVVSRLGPVLGGGLWVAAAANRERKLRGALEGGVLWFTGFSGAGKTTLARALEGRLRNAGRAVFVLDGDVLRQGLCRDLGFSAEDRTENIRRAAEVAKLMADAGFLVITAFISPLARQREMARKIIGEFRFHEIFLDTPLAVCEARDTKGLYARARKGELPEFTGISSPFESPEKPSLRLPTGDCAIDEALKKIEAFLDSLA
jgi:bifunctional enzyme CysN/CysC